MSVKLAEIEIVTDGGPWAEHNMPCAICQKKHAVLCLNTGRFNPCWDCQRSGWKLIRKDPRPWWRRLLHSRCSCH